jgi:hypothetical protein
MYCKIFIYIYQDKDNFNFFGAVENLTNFFVKKLCSPLLYSERKSYIKVGFCENLIISQTNLIPSKHINLTAGW